ncbi:Cys-tRNA(Pro) deacylase [Psychromonas antarctica]|uniref:Cys-tRNA(Pro) deacylase n=1 Tax=Psychromonas antarctica TaxID=67573 RepID=UPI001EE91922|nr:Cys-tRNA(Pro) deacylase [Psychromonas antarctica]MCG6201696.1 Cys-tRNA(Pro) deacylase [Psychromonas antarctica]
MTPAIDLLEKQKIVFQVHQYAHDKGCDDYGMEAVSKMGANPKQVFKTLVVNVDDSQLVVAILPVSKKLSMKQVAKVFSGKKVKMADPSDVQRSTGYILGGVSPLGQKKRLKAVLDSSALNFATVYVSAGRRGLEIELKAEDLIAQLNAYCTEICG